MRLLLLLICVALLLAGCATVSVTKTEAGDCKVVYTSVFKDLQAINGDVCGGKVEVAGSAVNVNSAIELLNAIK